MKVEQHVVIKIVDTVNDSDDVYDPEVLEEYVDSDELSSAEEAFLRGYLAA